MTTRIRHPWITLLPALGALTLVGCGGGETATPPGSTAATAAEAPSAHLAAVTTATPPGAPTGPKVKPGANNVSLSFTAPTSAGSSAVAWYTATCTDGTLRFTGSGPASPVIVSGLTQQKAYTCTVRATNGQTDGPASVAVAVNLPSPTPLSVLAGAPQQVTATPGNGSLRLAFSAPLTDGCFPVVGYSALCSGGGRGQALASPIVIGGLKNGTAYTCTVAAVNAQGVGADSATVVATPLASAGGPTPPGAPTGVAAVAGNGQATLSFKAPTSTGGSPITGYTATCSRPGVPNASGSGLTSPLVVRGLGNGQAWACTLVASNLYGDSVAAAAPAVTPSAALANAVDPVTSVVVSATVPSLAADGLTGVVAQLRTASGALYGGPDLSVSFTSRCAAAGQATLDATVVARGGIAEVTYQPRGCTGVDALSASVVGSTLKGSTNLIVSSATALSPKAALGKLMFFDKALSASGTQACASCHSPARQYLAPNATATQPGGLTGQAVGLRSVPSAAYAALKEGFRYLSATNKDGTTDTAATGKLGTPFGGLMWDGRVSTVFQQAAGPFVAPHEMANPDSAAVRDKLLTRPYLGTFSALYGPTSATSDANTVLANIANAIGQFESEDRSFMPFNSKYDAVQAGAASFSAQEASGQLLFFDPRKGACVGCHTPFSQARSAQKPAMFTDGDYRVIGVPRHWALPYNNDTTAAAALGALGLGSFLNGATLGAPNHAYYDLGFCGPMRTDALQDTALCGAFRAPMLRNTALKGSYFHNGVYSSLAQVIGFYVNRDVNPAWIYRKADGTPDIAYNDLPQAYQANVTARAPFTPVPGGRLKPAEVQDLLAFLCTLTDGYVPSQAAGYRQSAQCAQAVRR
jgi:cytochrome c peroxidase